MFVAQQLRLAQFYARIMSLPLNEEPTSSRVFSASRVLWLAPTQHDGPPAWLGPELEGGAGAGVGRRVGVGVEGGGGG